MQKLINYLTAIAVSAMVTVAAYANDGMYTTAGNHLVPMHAVDIDVTQERLTIRHEADFISVDVHYELENHGETQTIIVGFEAKPPSGDTDGLPVNGEHPNMRDFTVRVNGESLDYEVALVPTADYWTEAGLPLDQQAFYYQDGEIQAETEAELLARVEGDYAEADDLYVYHFTATFQPGKNLIDHHYRFHPSAVIGDQFNFDYVLKAINRWGNGRVEDFQMTLDMGDLIEFQIPNTFFDATSDWSLTGKGKIYATPKSADRSYFGDLAEGITTLAVHDGEVVFAKRNFTPAGDLYVRVPAVAFAGDFVAPESDLSLNLLEDIFAPILWDEAEALPDDDFTRKVLRNYPFARRGYVFKDQQVQAYYDHQPWYIADPNYTPNTADLSEQEQKIVAALK